ncbi:hypothetical protein G7Y79_00075g099160 [Physcia stellaris]|nr:hypothetical protein G7Y79_00075g099160 [Physcia stellaris]
MSGIEVAGIALAVFPIIIKGISHFTEGIETIKRWRQYRIRLQSYANVVETQYVYYLDTIEGLLIDIVDSEDDMARLMSHPRGVDWQSSVYAERLRQRLDRSYEVYVRTIKTMVQNLSAMCRKLGVTTSGDVMWEEYSVVEREMKRLKMTLSKNAYQELINAIEKANKDLRDITRQNIYLEPTRRSRKMKRPTADIKAIRRHAASLYQVLIAGDCWKCQCSDYHVASLRLELRPQIAENSQTDADSKFLFRVLLARSRDGVAFALTNDWQEIEVKPLITEKLNISVAPKVAGPKRGVRFGTDPSKNPANIGPSQPQLSSALSASAIADICRTLCTSKHGEPMGFLADNEDHDHKHYLYRADTVLVEQPQTRSLSEILSQRNYNSSSASLLKKERLEIAVTLASSVLQLDGTSWLKSRWSSHDIYFHEKNVRTRSSRSLYPYLPWKQCMLETDLTSSTAALSNNNHRIRSEVLFALGLTLIELCFGKTLQFMRVSEDEDASEEVANSKTAFRLLSLVYDEMGNVYGDVVRRCLLQPFDVRDMSLAHEEVQLKVYEGIVVPLVEELEIFKGISRIR